MPEVVVIATFTAQAGKEDEAAALLEGMLEPTHSEEGCLSYALHQDVGDARRFVFVESWDDASRIDAHMASPHVQAVLPRLAGIFDGGPEMSVCEPLPGGDPRKGSLLR